MLRDGRRRAKNISLRNLQSMIDGTSGDIRSDEAFEENIIDSDNHQPPEWLQIESNRREILNEHRIKKFLLSEIK